MTHTERLGARCAFAFAMLFGLGVGGCSAPDTLPGVTPDGGTSPAKVTKIAMPAGLADNVSPLPDYFATVLLRDDGPATGPDGKPGILYRIWVVAARDDVKNASSVHFVYDGAAYYKVDVPQGGGVDPTYLKGVMEDYTNADGKPHPGSTPIIR